METSQIITLLSGAGLGAVLSAILVFANNSKRNQLDYIVKERTEWRKKIEGIIEDLQIFSKRRSAFIRLKGHINPYGYNLDIKNTRIYFMNDGHIWDSLTKGNYKNTIYFLELLLKHDWERRKQEAKFQYLNALSWIVQIFFCVFTIYLVYLVDSDLTKSDWSHVALGGLSYSFLAFMLQGYIVSILKTNPSKNNNEKVIVFLAFFVAPYLINLVTAIVYTTFLNNFSIVVIGLLGVYVYEFYYLQLISNRVDEDYVKAIEQFQKKSSTIKSSKIDVKATKLNNDIIRLESKVYSYENRKVDLELLEKKRRKLRKKLIRKGQPNIFRHPIRFYRFLKNKKRVSKIVLRILN